MTGIICARPQNFAWFLGAGASRSAGLPTAADILWDMKLRYYCREENQDIARQDIQNDAVRDRIQAYMESKGFPRPWTDQEYSTYFGRIFGTDRERQRKYLKAKLAEDKARLSVGNRVAGAMMASGHMRAAFTTNFDSLVEKAVAETSGESLAAYHLEGAVSANNALNNEEYPLYCKLHGDFRYESLKNLSDDLKEQNDELTRCVVNAANRFGFLVIGYSGRDASTMALFHEALRTNNPFPHGLYWTGIRGAPRHPAVDTLLEAANAAGVNAAYVEIDTFDALMLRIWRNIEDKPSVLDQSVRKTVLSTVSIPMPAPGAAKPLMRMNALPILDRPRQCLRLEFTAPKSWEDLRAARKRVPGELILTRKQHLIGWATSGALAKAFPDDPPSTAPVELPEDLSGPDNLQVKGVIEEALCKSLANGKPLLSRTTYVASYVIANPKKDEDGLLLPLTDLLGAIAGPVSGAFTEVTEEFPEARQIRWAEALQVSLDVRDGQNWLVLNPDIWIWPRSARKMVTEFTYRKRSDRFNRTFNNLLAAWIQVILGTAESKAKITVSLFGDEPAAENPAFRLASRTAYAKGHNR